MDSFRKKLLSLPENSFYCLYNGDKYLTTKQTIVNGKIVKIYAEQLKGNDIVSGNYFVDVKGGLLKPCEMSDEKVINFVKKLQKIV
jgi:hypothetical protein